VIKNFRALQNPTEEHTFVYHAGEIVVDMNHQPPKIPQNH